MMSFRVRLSVRLVKKQRFVQRYVRYAMAYWLGAPCTMEEQGNIIMALKRIAKQ